MKAVTLVVFLSHQRLKKIKLWLTFSAGHPKSMSETQVPLKQSVVSTWENAALDRRQVHEPCSHFREKQVKETIKGNHNCMFRLERLAPLAYSDDITIIISIRSRSSGNNNTNSKTTFDNLSFGTNVWQLIYTRYL